MSPFIIRRTGAGYHSRLPENNPASALAIRHAIYADTNPEFLKNHMPGNAADILVASLARTGPIRSNDFSDILYYKLITEREFGFETYLDVSADLSDKICNCLNEYRDFDSFCDLLKSKDMTYTRISRCLLHILLNIKAADLDRAKALDYVPYARVLGLRKTASPLLARVKEHSSIPLVTKLADASNMLDKSAYDMLRQDLWISQIYRGIAAHRMDSAAANEIATPLVII